MQSRRIGAIVFALLIAVAAGVSTSQAGSFDFLFSVNHVSDDDQYFLNLTVSSYGYDRDVLEPVLPRLAVVENDLPVALFLARKSGKSVDYVVGLRARGMSWSAVFGKVGGPVDVLFVGIDRDPGPPYGKAWGHWRKKGQAARIGDKTITGLIQVQIGARWAGLSTYDLARARGKGKKVSGLVADKKGRPHKAARVDKAKGGKGDKPVNTKGSKRKEKSKGQKP